MPSYLADLDQLRNNSADPEEDDQDYLNPPPPSPSINSSDPEEDDSAPASKLFGTPIKSAAAQPRVKAAYDAVQSVNAERPTRTKPGFWRTLASLGVGLGAGYSNAGGKFKQQDVGQIVENGINGPYNRKMSDWQQKQKDAQETLKAAQEADKGEQEYLDAPVKREEIQANTDYLHSHTDLNRHQIDSEKARDRYLTLKDGSVYDTKNQSTIWKPQTPPDERIAFAKQQGWDPNDPAIQGWIMDGKSPGDTRPDRVQMVQGGDGFFHAYDTVTKQDTKLGIPTVPKTDPMAMELQREDARANAQQNQFDQNNRRTDQLEIDKLQAQEQKLHHLRGAIGREMRKTDNEVLSDPETGKALFGKDKKPMRRKDAPPEYWDAMRERLDQATAQATDLNEQQQRLARRNGGGGTASSDPLNLRK